MLQGAQLAVEMIHADIKLYLGMLFILHFLVAFEHGLYLMQKYIAVERFCNIVISAELVSCQNVIFHAFGRKEEQRHVRVHIPDFFRKCETIHVGHHHIKQANIKFLTAKSGKTKDTITSQFYYKVIQLQIVL